MNTVCGREELAGRMGRESLPQAPPPLRRLVLKDAFLRMGEDKICGIEESSRC